MSFNMLCFITASNTVCVIYSNFIIILLQSHSMDPDNHKQCNIEKHVNQYQKWMQVGTRFLDYTAQQWYTYTHTHNMHYYSEL